MCIVTLPIKEDKPNSGSGVHQLNTSGLGCGLVATLTNDSTTSGAVSTVWRTIAQGRLLIGGFPYVTDCLLVHGYLTFISRRLTTPTT